MKYIKKPVVVEAVRWNGNNTNEINAFVGDKAIWRNGELFIYTLEGEHKAIVSDYIIKGIKGEFYPCKEDIFHKTYEQYIEQDIETVFKGDCLVKEKLL